jgi:lipopolysaccharide/colanic/teichoic acid biosynthesis glycosyltransferase
LSYSLGQPRALDFGVPNASYSGARGRLYVGLKRGIDVGVAVIVLIVTLPLIALIWLLIRWDSPGPAIFRQTRIGEHERPFRFYKFRTMWVDARERFPALYAYRYTDEQINILRFQVPHDPRLTRVGRWLRTTSLDELPNLLNVLRGEMTLVGPRPQIPEMVPYYPVEYRLRFAGKPGLVGLAQVSGRGNLTFKQTMQADLETVRRGSFLFDMLILLRMVKCVALRVGAL